MPHHKFSSIAALMDADERGLVDDPTFDDELWLSLVELIATPQDVGRFAKPVVLYYASRLLQWEVGNGGFAQAAYNVPDWFELAAVGYDELGEPRFAAMIREAMTLLPTENRETTFDSQEIGELFQQFSESKLARLDERLGEIDWEADAKRLQYVRDNRQVFREVA
jgi:hypothetical protein